MGYLAYRYFCGDPDLPGEEEHEGGRLQYRRWGQWISAQHRGGVYDGEEGKIRDWNASLPVAVIEQVVVPAAAGGRHVVVLGEEWHTSWSMKLISDMLYYRGLRDRTVMLWNANNTFGFNRIDWGALNLATTITTVSRYMKFRMWEQGQNPIVIPNGIPRESIVDADPEAVTLVRSAAPVDHFWFKIGRFDPDKRWLTAVSAAAQRTLVSPGARLAMNDQAASANSTMSCGWQRSKSSGTAWENRPSTKFFGGPSRRRLSSAADAAMSAATAPSSAVPAACLTAMARSKGTPRNQCPSALIVSPSMRPRRGTIAPRIPHQT